MKKLCYESPNIRRTVPFWAMPAVMAGSEYPVGRSAGVETSSHGIGKNTDFTDDTFNHEWN